MSHEGQHDKDDDVVDNDDDLDDKLNKIIKKL